jgi:hypothetical protein
MIHQLHIVYTENSLYLTKTAEASPTWRRRNSGHQDPVPGGAAFDAGIAIR